MFDLGGGRWWDAATHVWRDGHDRVVRVAIKPEAVHGRVRRTGVVLATTHRDHDTGNNADASLVAFRQRCHLIHDRPAHRRRWFTLFRCKAIGDLFRSLYF